MRRSAPPPLLSTRWLLALALALVACEGDPPDFDGLWAETNTRVRTATQVIPGVDGRDVVLQRPHLLDSHGRYVHIRGINVSGSHKAPPSEEFPSLYRLPDDPELRERCSQPPLDADCIPSKDVSYIGRPFPLEEADRWYGQLAGLGFNSVRLITNWESIQPYRPGTCTGERYSPECYDLEYLAYYDALIAKAAEHGIYVLVDMHQDIFSRHLMSYFNENPTYEQDGELIAPPKGSLENVLFSLFPPFTDWARGHGAPRWVVSNCLPEKDLDSPYWGWFRSIGQMTNPDGTLNLQLLSNVNALLTRLDPDGGVPPWFGELLDRAPPQHFEPNETADFLPLTPWIAAGVLSSDVDRCFAALFAGDKVFPNLGVDDEGITRYRDEMPGAELQGLGTYLRGHYAGVFRELARRAAKYDNVIGYDVINEPVGVFIMLAVGGLYGQLVAAAEDPENVDTTPIQDLLINLLGEELGDDIYAVVDGLALLPTNGEPETLRKWGMDGIDLAVALDMNFAFEAKYLQPFFEEIGGVIQEEDRNAIIWFEPATSIRLLTGPQRFWDQPLTRPQGINQLVFAPHWYPDIYPTLGIDSPPRDFNPDEWLYRDFIEPLEEILNESPAWLGNIPVVFGEFGTYFNFGDIETSKANGYEISAHVIDSYYRAFEELSVGNMIWCFSAENDDHYGEWWNKENFSIIDPMGEPRAWPAYVRTHARATSGKLVKQTFHSQYRFTDPTPDTPDPERTYLLEMELRETGAPTEVFVPDRQYPDGFYVWLSDGEAYFDAGRQVLYWYPHVRDIGHRHHLRIEPRFDDREARGWRYFFDGERLLEGGTPVAIGGAE